LLPTAEKLLQPNSDLKTTARSLAARKRLQCKQYNRGTKNLIPLKVGEAIRMNYLGNRNGAQVAAHVFLADAHMKFR